MEDSLMYEPEANFFQRHLEDKAADVYDRLTFVDPGSAYNNEPPEPWISFLIGGILTAVTLIHWVFRLKTITKSMKDVKMTNKIWLRSAIAAAIDNDDATFTIVKLAGQSFLFLGGLQLDYKRTFACMLGWFAIEACGDTARILIAFTEVNNFKDLVVTSPNLKSKLRSATTQLKPSNVYEDVSRGRTIVCMVFLTQCVLISFVVTDIFSSSTHSCHDGTGGCPIVGTFGSYSFYILGIFMGSVFLLGPKTSFGQSEQNPSYWLQLLLASKGSKTRITWYDPMQDKVVSRVLYPSDWRLWLRFIMSFLINGVGFHILVHALPIQVAAQSSLTGVVFRAVGMMYLVDLDDTPGFTLTLVNEVSDEDKKQVAANDTDESEEKAELELAVMAEKIIADARAQLDELSQQRGVDGIKATSTGVLGGFAAGAISLDAANRNNKGGKADEVDDGADEGGDDGGDV